MKQSKMGATNKTFKDQVPSNVVSTAHDEASAISSNMHKGSSVGPAVNAKNISNPITIANSMAASHYRNQSLHSSSNH